MTLPAHFTAKVVGVTFAEGYPDNLEKLKETADLRWLLTPGEFGTPDEAAEPLPALLCREPDNEHDPAAVAIHIPSGIGKVGHLPRALAARLAPELDAGQEWGCTVEQVWIHPDHMDRPGITVECRRIVVEDGPMRQELEAWARAVGRDPERIP